jgi:hypothetical protein
MPSMSYCRHENTLADLAQVQEMWDDFDPADGNEYELRSRKALAKLILEMQDAASEYLDSL